VRNHRVQPDRSEKKCDGGKDREQDYEDPYVQVAVCDAVFQSSHVVNGQILAMMPSSSSRTFAVEAEFARNSGESSRQVLCVE